MGIGGSGAEIKVPRFPFAVPADLPVVVPAAFVGYTYPGRREYLPYVAIALGVRDFPLSVIPIQVKPSRMNARIMIEGASGG
jgi:hypothetical protein